MIKAYYSWNWGNGSRGMPGATTGVNFTGLIGVDRAILMYTKECACPDLIAKGPTDKPWISIGGGNWSGRFTASTIEDVIRDLHLIPGAGYGGVVFDVEGGDGGLVDRYREAFRITKELGLMCIVTTSHSGPYNMDGVSATELVKDWVTDPNIDYISPQLYSSGLEKEPEFAETNNCKKQGCTWDLYQGSIPKFLPSIIDATQFHEVADWFWDNYEIDTVGYIEWAQNGV